jgi:hypothetical protein
MTMKTNAFVVSAVLVFVASHLYAQPAVQRGSNVGSLKAPAPVTMDLTASTVTVHGVTPHGTAVIFAVVRLPQQHWIAYARREYIQTDDDGDGTVQVQNVYVAPQSIWCAIDLTTGASVVATPTGYELRRIDLPGNGVKRGIGGQLDRIEAAHAFLEGVVVRPGEGAWAFTAGDGGLHDADGQVNGRVEVDPALMRPIGASPAAPTHLLPHDTLILIDPFTMQLFSTEVQP